MQDFFFSPESAWGRCLTQFLRTRQQYTPILSYFLSHPPKMPDLYTQEDVLSYLSLPCRGQRNHGGIPSVATSNQRLAVLKSFYSFSSTFTIEGTDGHPERLLKVVPPTFGLKEGKYRSQANVFSFEELQQLFSVIPSDVRGLRDKAIFSLFFWTCRRRNEIARLRYSDISPAILIDDRGQRREGYIYRFKNKGDAGMDAAELPLPAKRAIDAYLMASGRIHTIQPNDPLFVSTPLNRGLQFDQSRQLDDETMARRLKYYLRQAGLSSRLSLHSFRHSGARARFEAGSDIREIQAVLRHSNLAVTDIYLRKLTGTSDPGAKLLEAKYGHL
jgi:site-specific recombinase XerD